MCTRTPLPFPHPGSPPFGANGHSRSNPLPSVSDIPPAAFATTSPLALAGERTPGEREAGLTRIGTDNLLSTRPPRHTPPLTPSLLQPQQTVGGTPHKTQPNTFDRSSHQQRASVSDTGHPVSGGHPQPAVDHQPPSAMGNVCKSTSSPSPPVLSTGVVEGLDVQETQWVAEVVCAMYSQVGRSSDGSC